MSSQTRNLGSDPDLVDAETASASVTQVDEDEDVGSGSDPEEGNSSSADLGTGLSGGSVGDLGIPGLVLEAYQQAAESWNERQASCNIRWQILAGVGKVESSHARGGQATEQGDTQPRILGPVLNGGPGIAAIPDTDGGHWDADSTWDRAVGPMQFIPGTWKAFGVDAAGDGAADPHNVFDATLSAAKYLCFGGGDLSTDYGLSSALRRYNNSAAYVHKVMEWIEAYDKGEVESVDTAGPGPDVTEAQGDGGLPDSNGPAPTGEPSDGPKPTDNPDGDDKPGGNDGGDKPGGNDKPDDDGGDKPGDNDDDGKPEPDPTEPEPDPTEPEPDPTEPEPDPTEPEPDPTEPEPDPTEPEPDPTEPEPDPTEPEPDPTEEPEPDP
ncbi:lytic transglycosylase domain-containing protein, partial [Phytoactinopolyspora endophytica]|uniref:lytic transglycosylase domain-containing protein n=1 Tax=Phytoactinopolyspora endophytica TaxID=1642495 RepID=UPI001F10E4D0